MTPRDGESRLPWYETDSAQGVARYYELRSLAAAAADSADNEPETRRRAGTDKLLLSLHIRSPWQDQDRFGPMVEFNDGTKWPDLDQVDNDVVEHCRRVTGSASNLIIKALYLDVLWETHHSHEDARAAISAYETLYGAQKNRANWSIATDAISRSMQIAWMLNSPGDSQRLAEVVSEELSDPEATFSEAYERIWPLAKLVVENTNRFTNDQLNRIANALTRIERQADIHDAKTDFHVLRQLAGFRARLHRKVGNAEGCKAAELTTGIYLEAQAAARGERDPLVKMGLLQAAIEHYNSIGEPERARRLANPALEAGRSAEEHMGQISSEFEIDTTPWRNAVREALKRGKPFAIEAVASDTSTIPKWQEAQKAENKQRERGSLLPLMPRVTLTQGRQVDRAQSEEEIATANTYHHYKLDEAFRNEVFRIEWNELRSDGSVSAQDVAQFVACGAAFDEDALVTSVNVVF